MGRLTATLALGAAALALMAGPASAQPVTCGQVITHSTTLDSDLTCGSETRYALVIGADGITLDLGGHQVLASSGAILDDGHDRVTIRHGTVSADDGGVVLQNANRNRIDEVVALGLTDGFVLTNSDGNAITSNTLAGVGIRVTSGSDGNTVSGNTVTANEGFIWVRDSNRNRILDNVVDGTDGPAIELERSHRSLVAGNSVASSFGPGIHLLSSNDNQVIGNTAVGSTPNAPPGAGVDLLDSSRNTVARNVFLQTTSGAHIASGADNALIANRATPRSIATPQDDAFRVDAAATGTLLDGNVAVYFEDGFDVKGSGSRVRRNTGVYNADLGVEALPGIIDLGGNRAIAPGNPLRCLNVVCTS